MIFNDLSVKTRLKYEALKYENMANPVSKNLHKEINQKTENQGSVLQILSEAGKYSGNAAEPYHGTRSTSKSLAFTAGSVCTNAAASSAVFTLSMKSPRQVMPFSPNGQATISFPSSTSRWMFSMCPRKSLFSLLCRWFCFHRFSESPKHSLSSRNHRHPAFWPAPRRNWDWFFVRELKLRLKQKESGNSSVL